MFLPRQKLVIGHHVWVDDQELRELVKQIIDENLEALESFEKLLGGEPVRDHW